ASLMPLPIVLAHRLAERLATVRKAGDFPWLRPDGKTQVSVIYEGSRPVGVSKLVVSTQHSDKIDNSELREGVIALVVRPVLADTGFDVEDVDILINPTGRFVVGGPKETQGSPAARSSSTPTAGWRGTAAARSAARTRPKSTARPPTRCAGWPRTSWPRSSPPAVRLRSPTRSAWPSRSP